MSENSHYDEARALLVYADEVEEPDLRRDALAAGLVHATLATVQRGAFERAAFTDTRTIPWPPSDELVKRVAKAIHDRRCQCRITTHWPAWLDEARAVLDAIFGEAVTSDE